MDQKNKLNDAHNIHSKDTPQSQVIDTTAQLEALLNLAAQSPQPAPNGAASPRNVLLVDPQSYRIESTINEHMKDSSGKPHTVDKVRARQQWAKLVETYRSLGLNVHVIKPDTDLPDIVFCANQTMPFVAADGSKHVLISQMRSPTRKPEVPFFEHYFKNAGFITHLPKGEAPGHTGSQPPFCFEGMGDLLGINHETIGPVILAGVGPRTDREALDWVAQQTQRPVIALRLPHPKFYHLDTCLSVLKAGPIAELLVCKDGLDAESFLLLKKLGVRIFESELAESDSPGFACNCHCPDEKNVLIQKGCPKTVKLLREAGYQIIELDTSEFIKAGGSVFCMKMMHP